MTAYSADWTDQLLEPPIAEWTELLNASPPFPDPSSLNALRASARRRLVDAAQQYTLRLTAKGEESGVPASTSPLLTGNPDEQKIVMTGHQPVIFHGGLTFKYHVTEDFAGKQSAIGVAIVIDTNLERVDQYQIPDRTDIFGGLKISTGSMKPYPKDALPGPPITNADRIGRGLPPFWKPLNDTFDKVRQRYGTLTFNDVSVAESNLIVRWSHGIGSGLLELPLSALSSFPETLTQIVDIINRADEFCDVHNEQLRSFRHAHDIRNAANPFPELKITATRFELPFWITREEPLIRSPLVVEKRDSMTILIADGNVVHAFDDDVTVAGLESLLLTGFQLIPRGTLITSFLRLLFSDLFVHGVGGGRYDSFTDEFIRAWWNVEPTPFVVASASTYLFAERRAQLLELESLQSDLRDLMFNPQRHFSTGRFSPELEERLRQLFDDKMRVVEQLKSAKKEGRSAKDIGHEIQTISDTMRQQVADEFEPRLKPLTSMTDEMREAIECRTYPWFLFP